MRAALHPDEDAVAVAPLPNTTPFASVPSVVRMAMTTATMPATSASASA
jgi:hypothetical protein